MKKIIKGKIYNTETAKNLGGWNNGYYSNFEWCSQELYQKRTGEFFVYGEGGPRAAYSESRDDHWTGGEDIIPLSYREAKDWAEEHLKADEYIAIFGEIEDDPTKTYITFQLSNDTIAKIKRNAAKSDIDLSAYLETLIP